MLSLGAPNDYATYPAPDADASGAFFHVDEQSRPS